MAAPDTFSRLATETIREVRNKKENVTSHDAQYGPALITHTQKKKKRPPVTLSGESLVCHIFKAVTALPKTATNQKKVTGNFLFI